MAVKQHISVVLIALVMLGQLGGVATAAPRTTLEQRIFPLNCIFDYVNDGTNTIYYVTPDICEPPTNPVIPQNPNETVVVTEIATDNSLPTPSYFYNRPTITASEQPSGIIYLNRYTSFGSLQGLNLNLNLGQVVYFDVISSSGIERHTITLKEITDDYVVVNISSDPFDTRIYIAETKEFDVTKDGIADISITVNAITNGVANMTFKKLNKSIPLSAELNLIEESKFNILPLIAMATVAVVVGITIYIFRKVNKLDL
jgi:hypothetical protein